MLRAASTPPAILEVSVARAGSVYAVDNLKRRWITGTPVVYIGKADARSMAA